MAYLQSDCNLAGDSQISDQDHQPMPPSYTPPETHAQATVEHEPVTPWKIMIIDDETEIHRITKLALQHVSFEGKPLSFLSAYSGAEAEALIREHTDTAVILLDVVMERPDSGLQLIKYIRDVLGNKIVRIVLRTGHSNEAPEDAIIREYDINDYKTKTELTHQRLHTTIILSLRTFLYLTTLQANQKEVEALYLSLSERNAELQRAKESAEIANHAKTEFLSTMSHELRTPLSVILMQSEIIQTGTYGPLTPKQDNSLELIHRSGRQLLELITDILDLSRIDAGKYELELGPTSVGMVCEFSLQAVQAVAAAKNIKIHTIIEEKIPMLRTDERRLVQILVNLLKNAIKFTPPGAEVGLQVKMEPSHSRVIFTVWDTGIGIAAKDIGRLFQPFIQLDSGLTRKYEGTGMGLSIVARVLNLLGGGIRVESQVDQGSRFIVTLPWVSQDPV
ncbi:MAG: hybrid sensor histidine kinase/response regulator [Chloroflexi bacterium]|nr:hybrid sensor histidine kinase/response regulator [Chloroflexota bacterium]